jgi:hypothetical protein
VCLDVSLSMPDRVPGSPYHRTEPVIDQGAAAQSDETTDLGSMAPSSQARRRCEIAPADA